MGFEGVFRAKAVPETGQQVVDTRGCRRAFFPVNNSGKDVHSFSSELEIMRGEFCRILYGAMHDSVQYLFNTTVELVTQQSDRVLAQFNDGRTVEYDLIIGADGSHSKIRDLILGDDAPHGFRPLRSGLHVAYFTLPWPIQEGEDYLATLYLGTKKRMILTRRSSLTETQVYLGYTKKPSREDQEPQSSLEDEKQAL